MNYIRAISMTVCAIVSLIYINKVYAIIQLDKVMSQQEQQQTGISNLSPEQRRALEAWMNQNLVLKSESLISHEGLSLSVNSDGGKKLQLSDGSVYEVSPDDVEFASTWISPFLIQISESGDPNYPILLTNTSTKRSIKVRKA